MPTKEQIESVAAEIERVECAGYVGKPWDTLSHREKYVALREIEWTGFTPK
jgi:hypothetical protein